jgi:hypothetical protein
MKIYIPLKDILLGPGKRFDPSVNSEAEVHRFYAWRQIIHHTGCMAAINNWSLRIGDE